MSVHNEPALVQAFGHVGLSTSDLERTMSLFRDVLGFEVTEVKEHSGEVLEKVVGIDSARIRIAYAHGHGVSVELLEYLSPAERRLSSARPCDAGHAHLAFTVRDLPALLERLSGHGFVTHNPPQHVESAGKTIIYAYGPDSLVLELSEID